MEEIEFKKIVKVLQALVMSAYDGDRKSAKVLNNLDRLGLVGDGEIAVPENLDILKKAGVKLP